MRPDLLFATLNILVTTTGCDGDRDVPHDPHLPATTQQGQPAPMRPSQPHPQAQVAGAPSDTAKAAPAGEPSGAAPPETRAHHKATGASDDALPHAPPEDTHPVPHDKTPSGGKDATS